METETFFSVLDVIYEITKRLKYNGASYSNMTVNGRHCIKFEVALDEYDQRENLTNWKMELLYDSTKDPDHVKFYQDTSGNGGDSLVHNPQTCEIPKELDQYFDGFLSPYETIGRLKNILRLIPGTSWKLYPE